MIEVSYTEIWSLWLEGQMVADFHLWGMRILWWGRIGKVIGLVSALAIVAEIIGPERLRNVGESIRIRYSFSNTWSLARDAIKAPGHLLNLLDKNNTNNLKSVLTLPFVPFVYYSWILLCLLLTYFSWHYYFYGFLGSIIFGIGVGSFFGLMISILIYPLIIFSVAIPLVIFNVLLLRPFAWVMEHKSMGKIIKVVSVVLLLVGFHFDLLAS